MMSGFDLIIRHRLSFSEVQRIVAAAFGITEHYVLAAAEYPFAVSLLNTKIFCLCNDVGGDFKQHISIEILDGNVESDALFIASKISQLSGSDCLMETEGRNPFAMRMFSVEMPTSLVFLRSKELDAGRYCLTADHNAATTLVEPPN